MKRLPVFIFISLLFCCFFNRFVAQNTLKKFKVANVKMATRPLQDTSYQSVIEGQIGKKVYAFCKHDNVKHLVPINGNGLISCLHQAYDQHRPLILNPDAIWLAICQGFSIHINENFNKYKSQLFVHDKPKSIFIRSDSLIANTQSERSKAWKNLMNDFSDSVKFYCKEDLYGLMVPKFSTTTETEKTVYEIVLLETTKKAFWYEEGSGCAFPEISLRGTKADWEKIYKKLDGLHKYGLSEWVNNLKPIIQEFINVYDDKIDRTFWNNMYKYKENYIETSINGWILKFFPYVKEYYFMNENADQEGVPNKSFRYIKNIYMNGMDYAISKLNDNDLPDGYAKIESTWSVPGSARTDHAGSVQTASSNQETKKTMECYAGFLGIKQNRKTLELEPYIGWAVCEKMAKKKEGVYFYTERDTSISHPDFWLNGICDKADKKPIYHADKNKSFEEGIEELKELLKKEKTLAEPLKIEFIITWGGDVAGAKILNESKPQSADSNAVLKSLKNLPFKWSPAILKTEDFENPKNKKDDFKINYKVLIEI